GVMIYMLTSNSISVVVSYILRKIYRADEIELEQIKKYFGTSNENTSQKVKKPFKLSNIVDTLKNVDKTLTLAEKMRLDEQKRKQSGIIG
ncbi:MAG: hypothetical protein MHPSP_003066, partial [Paramarteilia canceri]